MVKNQYGFALAVSKMMALREESTRKNVAGVKEDFLFKRRYHRVSPQISGPTHSKKVEKKTESIHLFSTTYYSAPVNVFLEKPETKNTYSPDAKRKPPHLAPP